MSRWIGRIGWLASVGVLLGVLLLTTHSSSRTGGDSTLAGRQGDLATCVLPVGAGDPLSSETTAAETSAPNCDNPALDRLHAPRMTAC